ncbi:hypothetical protein [Neobacillus dielmonensis]|uniref:hypothetical protein n=1 Tax=Neobacillus dielmonensis TaxID=1347369 RepID=UPI0005AA35BA|nr:hypothetical protein [Neobacillus dielmonensis]
MELGVKNKGLLQRIPAIFGFLSFLSALIALAGLNVGLLIQGSLFFGLFVFQLPFVGFFLGIVGLFTEKRSRLFAIWGFSLCLFLLVFAFLMIILSLGINYKP